jgi:hypothetical protein
LTFVVEKPMMVRIPRPEVPITAKARRRGTFGRAAASEVVNHRD